MMTIQDSIRQRLAGAEEAKLKAKAGKKKKLQVSFILFSKREGSGTLSGLMLDLGLFRISLGDVFSYF